MPDTLNGVIMRLVGFAFFAYCAYLAAKDSKRSVWYHLCWCAGLGLLVFVFSMTPRDHYSGGDGLTDPGEYVDTTEASRHRSPT